MVIRMHSVFYACEISYGFEVVASVTLQPFHTGTKRATSGCEFSGVDVQRKRKGASFDVELRFRDRCLRCRSGSDDEAAVDPSAVDYQSRNHTGRSNAFH